MRQSLRSCFLPTLYFITSYRGDKPLFWMSVGVLAAKARERFVSGKSTR
jgi:hypothetical protein